MIKNFLRFCELIMSSQKVALKKVFAEVKQNVLSYTGSNLRRIMKLMKKNDISELNSNEVKSNLKYNLIPDGEKWRLSILQEVLQVRSGFSNIEGFEKREIEEILEFVCTSWLQVFHPSSYLSGVYSAGLFPQNTNGAIHIS